MSYDISKYGWFGWHNMSAWISSRDGRPLRQCRITDLHNDRAKLHVDRAYEIPDEFLLQLTAWSKSAFECKVRARVWSSRLSSGEAPFSIAQSRATPRSRPQPAATRAKISRC